MSSQFNVEIPERVKKAILSSQGKKQLDEGKKVSLTDITLDAFSLWFAVDGLGFGEAFAEAKKRPLEKILDQKQESFLPTLQLSGDEVADLLKAIRKAVDEKGI